MKKSKTLAVILSVAALAAFFTACSNPAGPDGNMSGAAETRPPLPGNNDNPAEASANPPYPVVYDTEEDGTGETGEPGNEGEPGGTMGLPVITASRPTKG